MNKKEIQDTIERYNRRLERYGVSELALGWGPKGRSKLRFEVLLSQWKMNNSSVLDYGCGFGDLYDYIVKKGFRNVAYTGLDINDNLIRIARSKHSKSAKFMVADLLSSKKIPRHDFILSSGVFNYRLKNNMNFIRKCFRKFNELSRKGFAANFLSDKVSYTKGYTYHSNPAEILELAYSYSNNVVIRNDYMPFEFTVFVNKFSRITDFAVYEEYAKYV